MDNILEKILANKRIEVEAQKQRIPMGELEKQITDTTNAHSFKQALADSPTGIIAEFKRRSPSRGWIFENAIVEEVIPSYSKNGASAISVLTDFDFFGGTIADLEKARRVTHTPLLRKDFMIDPYQIYQAKVLQANAILLIAAALSVEQTKQMGKLAKQLGLDVLLEIHNEKELHHINEFVDVVGINNRNLSTFVTDIQLSFDLGEKIPHDFLKISESGISDPQTVIDLRQAGFKGFLMGENFMKTTNPGQALHEFIKKMA